MPSQATAAQVALKTPRAAAIAGVLFSILLLTAFGLLLKSARIRTADTAEWLGPNLWKVALAINLVPFAGIPFLWFVGALRDRLGAREDKLFATVFLGSGLLFVALLFAAAAAIGAIIAVFANGMPAPGDMSGIRLFRHCAYNVAIIYSPKMAAVFMFTVSTLIIRTGFSARWTAFVGYGAGLVILLGSQTLDWSVFVFPLWVLLVSISILADEYGRR